MRALVQSVTLALAAVAAAFVAWLNLQNHTPWPLALTRGGIAFAIVVAIGVVVGWVLMRTALRRHYETWLSRSRTRRARAER